MKKILLLIFSFLYYQCWSQGNMITINSTVPAQVTICGASKVFTISIYNPSPFLLTNDTLKLTMPSGIIYQPGTVSGATYLFTTAPNTAVFLLAGIPTLTSINISFSAKANCDVMTYISGGGLIENNIQVNYFANGAQNYDTQTTSSYIVRQPNLSISTITNQSFTGNIGDVFTRCITITNGGLGELSQFTLTDIHGSGIQISAISPGSWTNSGVTETVILTGTNFLSIGDGDNLFENGESITICETVHVLNCISVASAFEAYWGCNSQHCQTSVSGANVVFPNLIPNLVVTPIASMNSCIGPGNASLQQLKIINTGLGKAVNVLLDIFQSTNSGFQPSVGSNIDPASFTVQVGIAGTASSITPASTFATAALACMTNPQGRVLLTIPSINAGDTVYLKWNSYSCCWNSCSGFGQNYINGWRYSGSYENICQSSYVIGETWGRVYSQIYGALTNNGSPSTLTTGQTGSFNFLFSTYHHSFPIGPGAYWKLEFTLPACLTYVAGAGNLQILRSNGINTWSPSSVTTSGNVVTAIFNGNAPWSLLQAEIKINLTVNCAGCGGTGGSGNVSIKSFYIPNNICPCAIGVSCQNAAISVICPQPCPEGMIFSNFNLNRTSYGQPDNEAGGGNGLPDGSGSLDFTRIKTDRAMFGDTITSGFNGKVKTSFTNPSWQYCFAVSSMANGNRLTFVDATLKIYRAGLVIATCTNFTTPGNPVVTNSGSTRTFKYNLSVSILGSCLPGGFAYLDNDSLEFKPRYKVTSNVGNATPLNCYATNEFYLSDIANPILAANKFQCGNFNGNCTIIGYYFTNCCGDNYAVKSCNNVTISQNYYLSIGACCNNYAGGNLFPNEYRNWSHISNLTAILPPGYNFVSAQFNQVRTAGTIATNTSPWVPLTPVNPNSDTLTFPVEQYFQGFGGTIPLSDDGYHGTLQVTVSPSCKVTPTLSQGIHHDWTFAATPNNYLTGSGSASTFFPLINDYIVYEAPVLFLQSTLPSVNVPNTDASWDISVSNTSNTSNAMNAWLSGPTISGVSITQVFDLDNNVVILPVGTIYQIGTINAGVVRNFRITAAFVSCGKDSIIVYSGWNCNAGYPTTVETYPCTPKSIKLTLTPLIPALIVNVTAPPGTIQLCDTAGYTAEGVDVQLGTAYNVFLTAVLPLGVSIVPGSSQLSYPVSNPYFNISDPTFMGGTTWQWDISSSDSIINADGLKGILEPALNSFKLKFKVVTTCGYTSGSIIAFNLKGQAACGVSTGQEVSLSSQLGITGATTPYLTAINLLTTYISPCANNSSMHVGVHNLGTSAFGNADSVIIQLPMGVSFVPGSFAGIYNPPGNASPTQFTLNGSTYLIWKLPPGTTAGDSSVFTFGYKGSPDSLTCEITEFIAQTTSSTNVTCTQSGINCGINIVTGDTTLSVFTYKAYLSLSNGNAISIPNPPSGETVTVNLDITNTGQAILTGANSIIQFYSDANGNGIYNTGDVFLAQDTLLITNNSTIPYSNTFNVIAGQACSIIGIIRPAVNPCVCNPSQLLISPLLISLGNDSTLCSGETMVLSSPPISGYTYNWTPITGLSSANSSNPLLTTSNITTAPVSTDYILETNRMGCISKDTIQITVNPIPVSNAGADTTTCSVSTLGSVGTTSTTGYTYSWLPASGLSNTTISNPAVTLATPGSTTYTVTTIALGCRSTDSVVVKVNPLPTATIEGTTAICKDATEPYLILKGSAGTAPYTITYTINGGSPQTVSTTNGDSVSVIVPTNVAGTFVYTLVSVEDSSSTACSQLQSGSATVTVNTLPTATISGTTEVCEGSVSPNIIFTGSNGIAPYTFSYSINGGPDQVIISTGDSAILAVPTTTVGTFVYSMVNVQYGSLSPCSQVVSDSATIIINPSPTATIAGATTVCKDAAPPDITFTGIIGTAPFTFTYTINGGTNQVITTSSGNSIAIAAPTNIAGTFTYSLVSVEDSSASTCLQAQTGTALVTVNPLPAATIAGTTVICKGDAPPNIIFAGSGGTAPYTFTYTINGTIQPSLTTISGDSISVSVPSSVAGVYIYALKSIQDASSTACSQLQTGSATITVNPLPTATITGTVAVCKDDIAPNITFTGAIGTPPFTFTYSINSGVNQTVNTSGANSVDLPVPTSTAGVFTYTLISILDGSIPACVQTQSGSATVTVNPLPTATISGTAIVCEGNTPPVITFTGAGSTAPYTFTFTLNGVTQPTITTISGNSVTLAAPTNIVGSFTYDLVSVKDASLTTCNQLQSGMAIITVNPLPTATIGGTATVCKNDTAPNITFIGANGTSPFTFTYKINGGADQTITSVGDSIIIPAPTTSSGTFIYSLVSIEDAVSCTRAQSGTATITVNPLPTATIFGTTSVCKDGTAPYITFSGAAGTSPYTFTYTINGVTQPVIATSSGNSMSIPVATSTSGTFLYELVSIQDASSTSCFQMQSGTATVTVNPLPTAVITGTIQVCKDDPSPEITMIGADGQAPYTFTYTINGVMQPTITSTGDSAIVSVPTAFTNIFTYSIVSVSDASSPGCSQMQSGTATVAINPLPTATISGTTTVCENDPSPDVTLSGIIGTAPFLFTYSINGGPVQSISSVNGNSVALPVSTSTAGTITYVLLSVQDSSASICFQTQNNQVIVTVNPLPTAIITGSAAVCAGSTSPDITFTGASGTAPYTFTYSINGITQPTVTTSYGNSISVAAPASVPGTFTYTLESIQDGSSTACINIASGSALITINPNPVVNFKVTDSAGCEPLCVTFTDLSTILSGVSSVQWLWDFGDGNNSVEPLHCYTNDYIFLPLPLTVTLTVTSDSGCTSSLSKNNFVTVYPNPEADFRAQPQATTIIDPIITVLDASTGADFWTWDFGDLQIDSLVNPSPHAYADTGIYKITLVTSTQYGCLDTSYQTIIIQPDFAFYIPNAFSPNDDGINETFSGKGVFIKEFEMLIFDRWGNLVYHTTDFYKPWDGKTNHGTETAQTDVYTYLIKLVDINGAQHKYKGIVTLVR